MNYEAWNRYVLMAIGMFAALLYIAVACVGLAEFAARVSRKGSRKKRSPNRVTLRRLRNTKVRALSRKRV